MLRSAPLLLLLALLALQVRADMFFTNAKITASAITFVGGGTQSLAATNTTLTATAGNVDMSNFRTATSNTSRYVASGQVYFHAIGTETHAQDYFEGSQVLLQTSASASSFRSSNSVYNNTGNSDWGIRDQDTVSSTNDVFTGSATQTNNLYIYPAVSGTASNAVVSVVDNVNVRNMQLTGGSVTAKAAGSIYLLTSSATSTALSAQYLDLQDGVQLTSLTFTKSNPYNGATDVYFHGGSSSITNTRFVGLTGRFVATTSSFTHGAGRSEWQWIGSVVGSWNLQALVITGPAFQLGTSGQFWLTGSTRDFYCYNNNYGNDGVVTIRTNSPQHCVDVLPVGNVRPRFYCYDNVNQNALLFYPRTNNWYADNWDSNCCGPRVCASTSVMAPINGPTVVNGVSFTSTMRFQLTHTFTYADLFLPRVDKSDFTFRNGAARVVSVRQLTAETGAVNGVWTHVYEVTVEAQCDGLISLRYRGTVSRNFNDNRAGMQPQTNHLVYAGCLGQQFCL